MNWQPTILRSNGYQGPKNKAADWLSHLVELPSTTSAMINMLSVSNTDGPAFNTRSQTQQCLAPDTSTKPPSHTPDIVSMPDPTPKSLTADRLEALLQVYFSVFLNDCLMGRHLNMKQNCSPMSRDSYTNISQNSGQKFLALVIPKSWKYTVLVEAHDKLGHQGNTHTYSLIKYKYYWKGMNKDIQKYIANCTLCHI